MDVPVPPARQSGADQPPRRWLRLPWSKSGSTLTGARLRPRRRRVAAWHILIAVAALLALYALLGFLVAPAVARHYLVSELSAFLQREVTVREVAINPFKLTAAVRGVSVKERQGTEQFASFDELWLDIRAQSLWRRAPIIDEIWLRNPRVRLVRLEDGRYNISDLLEKPRDKQPRSQDSNLRFSFNNIQVSGGRVEFHDLPQDTAHFVTDLNFAVPFISNLAYLADRYVQPSLSGKLNNTPFAIQARSKPFDESGETRADLNVDALDLPHYAAYLPARLRFKVASGAMDARLAVQFTRTADNVPTLLISGTTRVQNLEIKDLQDRPLVRTQTIAVPIDAIGVFSRELKLGSVLIEQPQVHLRRNDQGTWNWSDALGGTDETAAQNADEPAHTQPIRLSLAQLAITGGSLQFSDAAARRPFETTVRDLSATIRNFAMPGQQPAEVAVAFRTDRGERVKQQGSLLLEPFRLQTDIDIAALQPAAYAPYFGYLLAFDILGGQLNVSAKADVRQGPDGLEGTVQSSLAELSKLRLRRHEAGVDFLSIGSLAARTLAVDLTKRSISLRDAAISGLRLTTERDPDGTVDITGLLAKADEAATRSPPPEAATAKASPAQPWSWKVGKLTVERSAVRFRDSVPSRPVEHTIEPLQVSIEGIESGFRSASRVALDAGYNKTARIKGSGTLNFSPLKANLDVDVRGVDIVQLQPYFRERLNVTLTSGLALARGALTVQLAPAQGPAMTFKGDAGVQDFASIDNAASEELLKWRSLQINAVQAAIQPFALEIRDATLADFYSRLIIYSNGRLNVQDIMAQNSAAPSADTQSPASQPPQGAPATAPATQEPAPPIRIDQLTLKNGSVNFTDLFIDPNYSANLTNIDGTVVGLSSQKDAAARIALQARFAKTAPVQIEGTINPFRKDLLLDLQARVRDIELSPFSPYSAKYVGYGIERGKMSFDVHYHIENRELSAKNRLTLNQLEFGERVESATATKLPVLLAVSLLKDRNGVIDVNVPISGSLDDPQFSVGGIVMKVILNVIGRAVTAPFALLGSLLGGGGAGDAQGEGGAALSYVEFPAGSAVLIAESTDKLQKLKTALVERPGLRLDMRGHASRAEDEEALRVAQLERRIEAAKREDLGDSAPAAQLPYTVRPDEYEKYLREVYTDAPFEKPRNAIGLTRRLPRQEMEKLLLEHMQVRDEDLLELANQRAQTVKDFLAGDQLSADRLFVVASRLQAEGGTADPPGTRVQFALR